METYSEAIDVEDNYFNYIETDIPIDKELEVEDETNN